MGNITDISEKQPHIKITDVNGKVHVIPLLFIRDVVKGRVDIDQLDDRNVIIRAIFADYFDIKD